MKKFATLLAALFIISLSPCASMLAHTAKAMQGMDMQMSGQAQGKLMDCCQHPQLKNVETGISIQQKTSEKGKISPLTSLIDTNHRSSLKTQLSPKQKPFPVKIMSTVQRE